MTDKQCKAINEEIYEHSQSIYSIKRAMLTSTKALIIAYFLQNKKETDTFQDCRDIANAIIKLAEE